MAVITSPQLAPPPIEATPYFCQSESIRLSPRRVECQTYVGSRSYGALVLPGALAARRPGNLIQQPEVNGDASVDIVVRPRTVAAASNSDIPVACRSGPVQGLESRGHVAGALSSEDAPRSKVLAEITPVRADASGKVGVGRALEHMGDAGVDYRITLYAPTSVLSTKQGVFKEGRGMVKAMITAAYSFEPGGANAKAKVTLGRGQARKDRRG